MLKIFQFLVLYHNFDIKNGKNLSNAQKKSVWEEKSFLARPNMYFNRFGALTFSVTKALQIHKLGACNNQCPASTLWELLALSVPKYFRCFSLHICIKMAITKLICSLNKTENPFSLQDDN